MPCSEHERGRSKPGSRRYIVAASRKISPPEMRPRARCPRCCGSYPSTFTPTSYESTFVETLERNVTPRYVERRLVRPSYFRTYPEVPYLKTSGVLYCSENTFIVHINTSRKPCVEFEAGRADKGAVSGGFNPFPETFPSMITLMRCTYHQCTVPTLCNYIALILYR